MNYQINSYQELKILFGDWERKYSENLLLRRQINDDNNCDNYNKR